MTIMTIELAPHHMLIVTDYRVIIPWSIGGTREITR